MTNEDTQIETVPEFESDEDLIKKIFGFTSNLEKTKEYFNKEYYDISEYHWNRILKVSKLFHENGIGPKVIDSDYDEISEAGSITYEVVDPLLDVLNNKHVDKKKIKHKIRKVVKKMHSLGYGHGDLHLGNIGMKNGSFVLLDFDTVYKMDEKPAWIIRWMNEAFSFKNPTLESFQKYDLVNWSHCL